MTLNEATYRILSVYRAKHKITDNVSTRLVKSWINSVRALLVKQKLDTIISPIDEALLQSLGPVELEEVDSSIFPDIPTDKRMKRTIEDIPHPVMRRGDIPALVRVGPADRLEHRFKVVNYETALYSGFGKFNSKDIYAFYLDTKVYFIGKDLNYFKQLQYVDIRGIFQDPFKAARFTDPDFGDDSPYPVSSDLFERIEKYIMDYKLPAVIAGVADETANERDDIVNLPQE